MSTPADEKAEKIVPAVEEDDEGDEDSEDGDEEEELDPYRPSIHGTRVENEVEGHMYEDVGPKVRGAVSSCVSLSITPQHSHTIERTRACQSIRP